MSISDYPHRPQQMTLANLFHTGKMDLWTAKVGNSPHPAGHFAHFSGDI
jgi:hypothetical protein